MNRLVTFTADLPNGGVNAGKIVVLKQVGRPVRFAVGGLTKNVATTVRVWDNSQGKGIAIDVAVPESEAKSGFDHWPKAEGALAAKFAGVEIVYQN